MRVDGAAAARDGEPATGLPVASTYTGWWTSWMTTTVTGTGGAVVGTAVVVTAGLAALALLD